jgi:putative tryptophan/tyrosine transport system substrate-binding protein
LACSWDIERVIRKRRLGLPLSSRSLRSLGWKNGRNLRVEYRWAAGSADQIRSSASELIAGNPDVILAATTPVVRALLQETRTIPVVFISVSDPVGDAFVHSLSRPSGNATGFPRS